MEAELDNIRVALEWAFSGGDPEMGSRLASSLWRFWYVRGRLLEGGRWLDRALAADFEPARSLEQKLLKAGAILARQLGDLEKTNDLTARRLRLARNAGDHPESAACLNNLGLIAWARGDLRRAGELFRESVSLFNAQSDGAVVRTDVPLGNLAWIALLTNNLQGAETFASESMALARTRDDIEQIVAMDVVVILARIRQGRMQGCRIQGSKRRTASVRHHQRDEGSSVDTHAEGVKSRPGLVGMPVEPHRLEPRCRLVDQGFVAEHEAERAQGERL